MYLSKVWLNNWLTMCDPGPLDHWQLVCPHGLLRPQADDINYTELLHPTPLPVFDHFVCKYGLASEDQEAIPKPIDSLQVCPSCQEEERKLETRRAKEARAIEALDSPSIGTGQHWYLISAAWLQTWIRFKSGLSGPPGPVDNKVLLDSSGQPRPNLSRSIHYRGVNERVWSYLHGIYGGGPMIRSKVLNIYHAEQSEGT